MKWTDLPPNAKRNLVASIVLAIALVGLVGYGMWTLGESAGYEQGHEDRSATVAVVVETVEAQLEATAVATNRDFRTAVAGAYERGYGDARATVVPGIEAFATSVAVVGRDMATTAAREADEAYQQGYQAATGRQGSVRAPTPAPRPTPVPGPSPAAASPLISEDVLSLIREAFVDEGLVGRVVDDFTKNSEKYLRCLNAGEPVFVALCLFAVYNR